MIKVIEVIEAETCCHLVTLNKINIHNTSCVLTCESLLLTCIHDMDFSPGQLIKYYNEGEPEYNNSEKDQ